MKYKLEVYGVLCSLKVFTINGESVNEDDFFTKDDESTDTAQMWGCGNMMGRPMTATPKVLRKYGLTVDEFNQIAEEAADLVSFGCCGWCV